jgi:hypothetical protein
MADTRVETVGAEAVEPSPAVQAAPAAPSVHPVEAQSLRFEIEGSAFQGRLLPAQSGDAAVLWVFGSGGGLGGPAGGIYARLGAAMATRGVASLELDYRRPGDLEACVEDVLCGLSHLESLGKRRVVLVGHSFGGAVVIRAGVRSPLVCAVCAMSSQTAGAEDVARLAPKPVLFLHGEQDEVLPASCSLELFRTAGDPKQLLLYPECAHGLDQCGTALDRDLTAWIGAVLDLSV